MMYAMYAEDVNTQKRKFMGGLWLSLAEAANYVDQLIELETWPHGTVAIAVDLQDDFNTYHYLYDIESTWEHCGRMIHEIN